MGLDVYLYRYDNLELYNKIETEMEKGSEEIWDSEIKALGKANYNDLNADEKKNIQFTEELFRDEKEKELRQAGSKKQIEINSFIYPDHLFKIGYLRSSYNDGGLNSLLRRTLGKDLYYVFSPNNQYRFSPDWINCRYRATELLNSFDKFVKEQDNYFTITERITPSAATHPASETEALKLFIDELNKHKGFKYPGGGSYHSGLGSFFLDEPIKASAFMVGTTKSSFSSNSENCVYVIYKNEEGYTWYRQALEITIETIDWVLSKPDQDKYALHWSS